MKYTFQFREREGVDDFLIPHYQNFSLTNKCLDKNCKFIECIKNGSVSNIYCVKAILDGLYVENSFYFSATEEELDQFCSFVWEQMPTIDYITFNTLLKPLPIKRKRALHYLWGVDNIAFLPESFNQYLSSLGKQTAKHSKYNLGRVRRDFA